MARTFPAVALDLNRPPAGSSACNALPPLLGGHIHNPCARTFLAPTTSVRVSSRTPASARRKLKTDRMALK